MYFGQATKHVDKCILFKTLLKIEYHAVNKTFVFFFLNKNYLNVNELYIKSKSLHTALKKVGERYNTDANFLICMLEVSFPMEVKTGISQITCN